MTGRQQHYAQFYGRQQVPRDDRPLVVVHGNCQAESLRVLLDGTVRTVRIPPAHELAPADLPHLDRVLELVDVLVTQPVRDGYRNLPVGTRELHARAARNPRLVVVPVIRWAALHPFQVIVRSPAAGEPPIVPYHDLRWLTRAAGRPELPDIPSGTSVRAVRDVSIRELRERQERHGTLDVVDLLTAAEEHATHTVNHPGNEVLLGLAHRVLEALGEGGQITDPRRTLLDSIHAPVRPDVLHALGCPGEGRVNWLVHGRTVPDDEVREAHLRWYQENPGVAEAGLERHAEVAAVLAA